MTNLYNVPSDFREEMIYGYIAANSRTIERVPNASGIMIAGGAPKGKVSVLTGGGSGHYPTFFGMVGKGLATGAAIGEIFTSPSTEQIYRCTKAIDGGAGVLYVVGNYNGDVMNFGMAETRCQRENINIRTVIVTDDVAVENIEDRRGIAGLFFVMKTAGASAARGDDLATVAEYAQRANARTRSFGIAFAGCTIPGKTEPLFSVEAGKMELGLGIHGEPGIEITDLLPARDIAALLVNKVMANAPVDVGSRAVVMLNGLGATKYEELFVLYGDIHKQLQTAGIEVCETLIDEFATSLDMKGCSLTLLWVDDDLKALYDAPASTPVYTKA
ncbi:MAG: dihydroxyacetone kinase subunit DhaK [Phototrophicaceae bacterium]|jgi:dihydroxyacetone kinase